MTPEEAEKVASVIVTADFGCESCVRNLAQALQAALPGHDWAAHVSRAANEGGRYWAEEVPEWFSKEGES